MRILLLLLGLGCALLTHAQRTDNPIVIGHQDTIFSKVLKESRNYWVHLPQSYQSSGKTTRYPVLYLLDGDAHFHSVTGLVHQLASGVNGNTLFPEMIVVAILNTDRTRDLTPSVPKNMDPQQAAFLKTAGGGENFISFLRKELMPAIESKYNTAPYRVLVGHSFGGLTAMHILMNHTELFNAYIAIDPSMWWSNSTLLNQMEKELPKKNFKNRSLYLSIANTLPPGMLEAVVDKDTSGQTEHIRSIRKTARILEQHSNTGLDFKWAYFDGDDHGSVPLISEYQGLRTIFSDYKINNEIAFNNLDSLQRHYARLSQKMGYTLLPPEGLINQVGYLLMQANEMDKAIAAFELNIKNHPQSTNVYDSMGDAWLAKGDKKKAKEYFEKALKVDPNNAGSREKLSTLK